MQFKITIKASKQQVWNTMLNDETYRQWTEPFMPGGYYEGSWEQGSSIKFLAPNDKGQTEGMISRIAENRPYEFVSIEHLGEVKDGKEDTTSDSAKQWQGVFENYTFQEKDGGTELTVDLIGGNMSLEMADMFKDIWPKALDKLKDLCEGQNS